MMQSCQNGKPLISVIVPAYKVAPYILRCVQSILDQSYQNLEVIVVNDCSPDETGSILEELEKADLRLRVVNLKTNVGLHAARKVGLSSSHGEFIAFVDGDDWISPRMYEELVGAAEREKADIAVCGAVISFSPSEHRGTKVHFKRNRTHEEGILGRFCGLQFGSGVIWNKVFRSNLIRDAMAVELEREVDTGADYIVNFGCFAKAGRVVLLKDDLYHYFFRRDSMSRVDSRSKNFATALRCYVACLEAYASQRVKTFPEIDRLYALQLRMSCYRVDSIEALGSEQESIASSLQRLAQVHPAGAYSWIHAFDPAVTESRASIRQSMGSVLCSLKAVVQAFGRSMRESR